ncbi:MAG TPA: hypothetical protein VEB86_02625 [Chryseosolibacter sp.]|nr:hypothetical protein [Chryseosolibacter sp.]
MPQASQKIQPAGTCCITPDYERYAFYASDTIKNYIMEKSGKKTGPKDRSYVNKDQKHEVKYEKSRKTPAKQFGSGSKGSK